MDRLSRRDTFIGPEEPIGLNRLRTQNGVRNQKSNDAPRRTRWDLNAEKIIEKMKTNLTFKVGMSVEARMLPNFADMTRRYGLSEDQQVGFFSSEIRRLVQVVNSAQPICLDSEAKWFGQADADGYERLHKLARQIKAAISICLHDAELQMLEFHPARADAEIFRQARVDLLSDFDPSGLRDPLRNWDDMRLAKYNTESFHAIVDYLTGTATQVLLRTMEGDLWDDNCIIFMAKCAAKIKVVALNLVEAAEACLAGKREWALQMQRIIEHEPHPPKKDDENNGTTKKVLVALARCVVDYEPRYFESMNAFGTNILKLLEAAAIGIGSVRDAALPPDVFETSVVVYDTPFRGRRSLLCQERDEAIGASSNREEIHCTSFTFEVCLSALEALDIRIKAREVSPVAKSADPITMVCWKWTELRSEPNDLTADPDIFKDSPRCVEMNLSSMSDVITAFIPFQMICGRFTRALAEMLQAVRAISYDGDPIATCVESRFLAFFMIQTSKDALFKKQNSSEDAVDVTSVSTNPIAAERALATGPMSATLRNLAFPDNRVRAQLLKKNQKIQKALETLAKWTIDDSSITIKSRWYCWGTLGCSGALVAGGLAIGFSLNKRIAGVDPFNISVFCWVLAGFFIIFMKSLRVENWPWRDFFRGRVVCRSVSEVTAVSGVDAQLLLTMLIHLEPTMIMNKKGPFHRIFWRHDKDLPGFIIDVPCHTESLIDASVFFIKVQSTCGPALVCVRGVGDKYFVVGPRSYAEDGHHTKCLPINFAEPGSWGKGKDKRKRYGLATNYLRWSKVIGIYSGDAYFG